MIWTALILGFAGSLHCVGMCSPLALAVTKLSPKAMTSRLLYNLGRILTYGILGAVVASVGFAFPISKYQDLLSLLMGTVLVIVGFVSVSNVRIPVAMEVLTKINSVLKDLFSRYLQKRNFASVFLLGTLNGFLPCGLSFLALTYSVILKTPLEGFTFMILFGIGTLPALIGFSGSFHWIVKTFRFSPQRVTTSLFVISGVMLIARVLLTHSGHAHSLTNVMIDSIICGR